MLTLNARQEHYKKQAFAKFSIVVKYALDELLKGAELDELFNELKICAELDELFAVFERT